MKTFKEFANEMAKQSEYTADSTDFEETLRFYVINPSYIKDEFKKNNKRLIRTVDNSFLLTNKNDEFLGGIYFSKMDKNGYIQIEESQSKLKSGFYSFVFPIILSTGDIKGILSDKSLSKKAIKAYENLFKKNELDVMIYKNGTTAPFSTNELLQKDNLVLIKDKK